MVSVGWTVIGIKCSNEKHMVLRSRLGWDLHASSSGLSPRERIEVDKSFDPYEEHDTVACRDNCCWR